MPFSSMDWSGIQDAMVEIENAGLASVVSGSGLWPTGSAFNALKYQPARITGYPRSFRLGHGRVDTTRSARGAEIAEGDYNEDCWIQIGVAVGAATEPRTTAQPKAEAFEDPIIALYRGHLSINGTVDAIQPNGIRVEIGDFKPPAQEHYGLLVTIYFRKIVSMLTAE